MPHESQQVDSLTFLEGLGRSFVSSWPELVGVNASSEVEQWRAQNPVASVVSQLGGFAVPVVGYAAAAARVPRLMRAVEGAGRAFPKSEFAAGAAREIVRFAPFEAGRIGTTALIGESLAENLDREFRGLSDVAIQAGTELTLGAGIAGGLFKVAQAAGRRSQNRRIFPGANLNDPPQLQIRQIRERLEAGQVGTPEMAERALRDLRAEVRLAGLDPKTKQKFVFDLTTGVGGKKSGKELNRLFKVGRGKKFDRLKFAQTVSAKTTLGSRAEVDDALNQFDLAGKEEFVQFPRFLKVNSEEGKKTLEAIFRRNMESIDSARGIWWARDIEDGMFIMAKKGKGTDNYAIFKTDSPGEFVASHKGFADMIKGRTPVFGKTSSETKFSPLSEDPGAPTQVFDSVARFKKTPVVDFRGLDVREGGAAKITNQVMSKLGLDKIGDNQLLEGARTMVRDTLVPAMLQFRGSPIPAHIFAAGKIARQQAEAVAERLFLGERAGLRATPFGALKITGPGQKVQDSIEQLVEKTFDDLDEWVAFQRTVISGLSIDEGIEEFGLGPAGQRLLEALQKADDFQIKGLQAVQKVVGDPVFQPRPYHYMLSRFWEGDWRIPIREGGRNIGYAAARKRGVAENRAAEIIEEARKDGIFLTAGNPHTVNDLEQTTKLLSGLSREDSKFFGALRDRVLLSKGIPKRMTKERKGAIGFIGDRGEIWTKEFVKESILRQLRGYQNYMAKASVKHMYQKEITNLIEQDPVIAEQVAIRLRSTFGEQGPIEKSINQAADKVLAPVLGKDSASKVVSGLNKAMFRLTFSFVNTGFNIANAMTFIQTAYPHLAYLTTAAPSRIMRDYTYWPVMGERTAGAIGMLDMLKLTGRSFANMGHRAPEQLRKHFERAVNDGTVSPRFVEEWVGENSTHVRQWREALSGKEPFSAWLGALVDFLPSTTEKFARGHAFSLGHTFFKDIMNVKDDELLYQLSKQFVEKTQFLYGSEDRARIMAGPLGGAFGLFKNWLMHYLAWNLEYAGEGMLRGNWKPLLWSLGGTTALGGIGGLPFFGAANTVSKWMSDESLIVHTHNLFNGEDRSGPSPVADAVYYGFPALLGFSIQNQVAAPFADPGRDAAYLFSFVYADRLRHASKFMGEAVDNLFTTGQPVVTDARTRDLFMRAFAPKSIYRLTQALQGETLNSLSTGRPVIGGLSPGERFLFGALSLDPLDVARQFEVSNELWQNQNKMRAQVTALGKDWAEAMQERRPQDAMFVLRRAIALGVDVSSVLKSGETHIVKGQQDVIERNFSPEAVFSYRRAGLV